MHPNEASRRDFLRRSTALTAFTALAGLGAHRLGAAQTLPGSLRIL